MGDTQFLDDGRLLRTVGGEVRIWSLPPRP
jgi:hypothetical protein